MNSIARYVLAAAALTIATQAVAQQITFFEREGYEGRSVTTGAPVSNLEGAVRASSAVVSGEWEVCDEPGFTGRCVIMLPGEYPSLRAMGLNKSISSARTVRMDAPISEARPPAPPASPQITFYEQPGFQGRAFVAGAPISNLERVGRASSLVVLGGPWQVCDGERFSGRCVVLRPGRYPSFGVIGLNGAIASVRPAV